MKRKDPKAGEIWTYWSDPTDKATEHQGVVVTIPALQRLPHRTIAPVTFLEAPEPFAWMVPLNSVADSSRQIVADANRSTSVGLAQFTDKVGKVSIAELLQIRDSIGLCLGINSEGLLIPIPVTKAP